MARVCGMAVGYGWVGGMAITFLLVDLVKLLYLSAHTCILVLIPLGYGCSFITFPSFCSLFYGAAMQCSRSFMGDQCVDLLLVPIYLVSFCVVVTHEIQFNQTLELATWYQSRNNQSL